MGHFYFGDLLPSPVSFQSALTSVQRVKGEQASMAGKQTETAFGVADFDAEYRRLSGQGVKLTMRPEQ